jgi:hypothetical protein
MCRHCGVLNVVASCQRCGRPFVVTHAHMAGLPRGFESEPLSVVPDVVPVTCDFTQAQDRGDPLAAQVMHGLRQATCAACHTEMLSIE